MDDFLKKSGLKYEQLEPDEIETLHRWIKDMQQGEITIEKAKSYLEGMRDTLLIEMCKWETGSKQDLLIKARVLNYGLLIALFTSAEKAKKQLETYIKNTIR